MYVLFYLGFRDVFSRGLPLTILSTYLPKPKKKKSRSGKCSSNKRNYIG